MTVHVTNHACSRFIERVAACSIDQAREHILAHTKAIEAAAAFHCEVVLCGNGERLILQGTRVLTVYAAHERPRQCRSPFRRGGDFAAA
jgi:hypothetical protein